MNRINLYELLFLIILLMPQGLIFAQSKPQVSTDPLEALRRSNPNKTTAHLDMPAFDLVFRWDSIQGTWDTIEQMTFSYYPDGSMLAQDYSTYSQGIFTPEFHYDYYQDTAGVDYMSIRKYWSGGNWIDEIKETQDWNPQATKYTQIIYEIHNAVWDSIWTYRSYRSFGAANELLREESYSWENWRPYNPYHDKTIYHYTQQVVLDSITNYVYDGGWVPKTRHFDFVWHDQSLFLPSHYVRQLKIGNAWYNDWRFTNTYGSNNSVESLTERYVNDWTNLFWSLKRIDAQGHQTYAQYSTWNGSYFPFEGYDSTEYVYDLDGHLIESIPLYPDTATVSPRYRHLYGDFFTEAPKAVLPQAEVTAFPNPATDVVYFDLGDAQHGRVDIHLFDLQGKLRVTTSAQFNGQAIRVPISERLPAATYVYRVFARGGVSEGKVIVQR